MMFRHAEWAYEGDTSPVKPRLRDPEGMLRWVGQLGVCAAVVASIPAHAADGCTVLLCLAAPSWRSVSECVPPVRQTLRNLALGKPFPVCTMAGIGNSVSHAWSAAPGFCPPQYTRSHDGPDRRIYTCDYDGAIMVSLNGVPFAQTWWSIAGEAVTEFSPVAKAQLGAWDTRFDDEFAAWLASRPVPAATPD